MPRIVLFVDNDEDFLETRSESLERAGYTIHKATSFEQAEQILQNHWIHVAILDLRLRDENDARDTSGLVLAKKKAYRSIPKIILTKFPGYESVREALGPVVEGLPPAVDFLHKREGVEALIQAIERAYDQYVRIDQDLTLRCENNLSFFFLASLIDSETDTKRVLNRAEELEDLFRRLFYGSKQVVMYRLLARQGQRLALVVFDFSDQGTENQFLVTCGRRLALQDKAKRYDELAPQATREGRTVRTKSAETIHFGAAAYTLTGANLDQVTTLAHFYQENPAERVTDLLNDLFQQTLAPWYRQGRFREAERTLADFFQNWLGLDEAGRVREELERKFEDICRKALAAGFADVDYNSSRLTFHRLNEKTEAYPNPVHFFAQPKPSETPVLCGVIYGQLNGDSILADRQAQSWLIDFSRVDRGPLLHDFVKLETVIKFELLTSTDVQARTLMEQRLLAAARLDEAANIDGLDIETQKAVQAINQIRRQAAGIIGFDFDLYRQGLLFYAAHQLLGYNPETHYTRRELVCFFHGLFSAALLTQQVMGRQDQGLPDQAFDSIWIDEPNQEVWVEGNRAELTAGEYDLLVMLYQNANQLCTRQDISKKLYDTDYGVETEDAINTTMTRLRRKIEPNSDEPKYIVTVRGKGYWLKLK